MRGADTANVRSRKHNELSTHGLLKEVPKADLRDWVYQLIGQGVLVQSNDEFPLLKLNAASWEVMGGKRDVRLIRLVRREKRAAEQTRPSELPLGRGCRTVRTPARQLRRQEALAGESATVSGVHRRGGGRIRSRGRPQPKTQCARVQVGDYRSNAYGKSFLTAIVEHCRRTGLPTDVPLPQAKGSRQLRRPLPGRQRRKNGI